MELELESPKSPPLFHHPQLGEPGQLTTLSGDEAAHIHRARRLGSGDAVHLTDGNGNLAHCKLASCLPRPLTLELQIERIEKIPRSAVELVLAAAVPKGEAQAVLLDMATQLGVAAFIPLRCERSVVAFQPRMRPRWQRIIASACKQCRQCHFPVVEAEMDIPTLLQAAADTPILVGARDGLSLSRLDRRIIRGARRIVLLVGPEGGLSRAESRMLARHGVANIALAAHILRIETAAIALLAVANQLIEQP